MDDTYISFWDLKFIVETGISNLDSGNNCKTKQILGIIFQSIFLSSADPRRRSYLAIKSFSDSLASFNNSCNIWLSYCRQNLSIRVLYWLVDKMLRLLGADPLLLVAYNNYPPFGRTVQSYFGIISWMSVLYKSLEQVVQRSPSFGTHSTQRWKPSSSLHFCSPSRFILLPTLPVLLPSQPKARDRKLRCALLARQETLFLRLTSLMHHAAAIL